MTDKNDPMVGGPCENTDRELWREREGDYYADSIHVTQEGGIGIDCGGTVYVKPVREWHRLAGGIQGLSDKNDPTAVAPVASDSLPPFPPGFDAIVTAMAAYVELACAERVRAALAPVASEPVASAADIMREARIRGLRAEVAAHLAEDDAHPPALSEEFIQEAMRLADDYRQSSRAALEAHLRGKG